MGPVDALNVISMIDKGRICNHQTSEDIKIASGMATNKIFSNYPYTFTPLHWMSSVDMGAILRS